MAYTQTNIASSNFAPTMNVFAFVKQAMNNHKQRRQLANLPAEMLNDIGLTKQDVAAEMARPLWSSAV